MGEIRTAKTGGKTMASGGDDDEMKEPEWMVKKREYEQRMARAKNAKLRTLCTICGKKAKLPCPCGTAQYCTVACQKIDWRDRGHRKACKKIRDERAAEAARAEAPTPPPRDVVYGPAPRSHADEVRARIAAEHEAARARREANPEREPLSARYGGRCSICLEEWDVNAENKLLICCCQMVCRSCADKIGNECPLCRVPRANNDAETLARLRRHVENEVPEAVCSLGTAYLTGKLGLVKSSKKAMKLFKRAMDLGDVQATAHLAQLYNDGAGVKIDKKKTIQLLRKAADGGHAGAQYKIAGHIGTAATGEQDLEEAFRYTLLSATQGLTGAQWAAGMLYQDGAGVAANAEERLEEAKRWYTLAAAKGYEPAIKSLRELMSST